MTFLFGGFLRQDVTLVSMGAFEFAPTGFAEAFGRAAIGFEFWHLRISSGDAESGRLWPTLRVPLIKITTASFWGKAP